MLAKIKTEEERRIPYRIVQCTQHMAICWTAFSDQGHQISRHLYRPRYFSSETSQGLDQQDRWHLSSQTHTTTNTEITHYVLTWPNAGHTQKTT